MPNVDDIIMPVLPSSVENFKDYNGWIKYAYILILIL
jgi:hypothetical protein